MRTRRQFLSEVTSMCVGGVALANAQSGSRTKWADRLGLQVYTVRDRLTKDFDGTIARIADAGYREVELFGSLGDRPVKAIRAVLDRAGVAAVSTHIAVAPGPDLDLTLERYSVLGHRYTAVRATPPGGASGPGRGAGGGRGPAEPNTPDRWKRQAETLNHVGLAGKKHGIRALVHNHVEEFVPIDGTSTIGYDILLAETDRTLVAMELDIGWASIAGQDVLAMFKAHPGRFPLWHVKDTTGLAAAHAKPIRERQAAAQFVPVGAGDIDYKKIFAAAEQAGLQHYFVEQDNAVAGDSIAAIRTSAQNLTRLLG